MKKTIVFDNTTTTVNKLAFDDATTEIVISEGFEKIAPEAFQGWEKLEKVTFCIFKII